jgi:Domain of unknown function (DUF397)
MIPAMTDITGWRKPERSFSNGNCVEVGSGPAVVGVRDTKLAASPVLCFSAASWNRFAAGIKRGAGVTP